MQLDEKVWLRARRMHDCGRAMLLFGFFALAWLPPEPLIRVSASVFCLLGAGLGFAGARGPTIDGLKALDGELSPSEQQMARRSRAAVLWCILPLAPVVLVALSMGDISAWWPDAASLIFRTSSVVALGAATLIVIFEQQQLRIYRRIYAWL